MRIIQIFSYMFLVLSLSNCNLVIPKNNDGTKACASLDKASCASQKSCVFNTFDNLCEAQLDFAGNCNNLSASRFQCDQANCHFDVTNLRCIEKKDRVDPVFSTQIWSTSEYNAVLTPAGTIHMWGKNTPDLTKARYIDKDDKEMEVNASTFVFKTISIAPLHMCGLVLEGDKKDADGKVIDDLSERIVCAGNNDHNQSIGPSIDTPYKGVAVGHYEFTDPDLGPQIESFSCFIRENDTIACQGNGPVVTALLNPATSPDGVDADKDYTAATFSSLQVGNDFACATVKEDQSVDGTDLKTGDLVCWGDIKKHKTEFAVDSKPFNYALGRDFAFGILDTGLITFSGQADIDALNFAKTWNPELQEMTGIDLDNREFSKLSVGVDHTCALLAKETPLLDDVTVPAGKAVVKKGEAICWGNEADNKTMAPKLSFLDISVAPTHTCGISALEQTIKATEHNNRFGEKDILLQAGEPFCWGANESNREDALIRTPLSTDVK